jgi:hypothetical protein
MYPICKWQQSDYYGITNRYVHSLMNLMFVWFFIHPLTNLMLHDFSFIHQNEHNVSIIFDLSIDKQSLLMSFVVKCLIMGCNVIIW